MSFGHPNSIPSETQISEATPPASLQSNRESDQNDGLIIALPEPLSEADTLQFLARSFEEGRFDEPDVTLAMAMLGSSIGRATAQWLLLRSNIPQSFQAYEKFQNDFPNWPFSPLMRRRAETALMTSGTSDTTKKAYFTKNPPETTIGKILWSKTLLAAGESQKAIDIIRPVWRNERLQVTAEQQLAESFASLLNAQDYRARMLALMANREWEAALRIAKKIGPGIESIVKARIAVIQNDKKALAQLDLVPKDNQTDPLQVYSRLLLLMRAEKFQDASLLIGSFVRSWQQNTSQTLSPTECRDWQIQQRRIIRELMDKKQFEEAYAAASISFSKLDCLHHDAEFFAGWIAFRFLNSFQKAQLHFDNLAVNALTSSEKARAFYWKGRLADKQGQSEIAEDSYKKASLEWTTFYGQLASQELSGMSSPIPNSISTAATEDLLLKNLLPVQSIRLLAEGDAPDLATSLYQDLASSLRDKNQFEALASLAETQRNPRAMLIISKIAMRRGFDLGQSGFPSFGMPQPQGINESVEISLIYAIAHQESAFNPKAKSSAGALGLMQLMPETAKITAKRRGLTFEISRLTTDPTYNTTLGAAHLKDLINEWDGSLILTFAAYNAGSGNVRKWIRLHGDPRSPDIDTIDWIERIPFYETRHYVQRISTNLLIYRRLLDSSNTSSLFPRITTSKPKFN